MTALAKLTGLSSPDVRQMVLNARTEGLLVCSCDEGYYFPKNEGELTDYIRRRRKYIRTAQIALQPFENTLTDQKEGDP